MTPTQLHEKRVNELYEYVYKHVIEKSPKWVSYSSRSETERNMCSKELPEVQKKLNKLGWKIEYHDGYVNFDMTNLPYF